MAPPIKAATSGRKAAKTAPATAAAAPAPKVKAAKTPKVATPGYLTEVRLAGHASLPARVDGNVAADDNGFRIILKRPRSPKVDTFIIPIESVYVAEIGERGYIVTDHPSFQDYSIPTRLDDVDVSKDGELWAADADSGAEVFINTNLAPVTARLASYAE